MPDFLRFSRVIAAAFVVAAGLVVVGWFDYTATRADVLALLRAQARSLGETVAAAARSNDAAGAQAEAAIAERLLDNARLLAELERHAPLTQARLDEITARNRLFRVMLVAADGSRERMSGGPGSPPPGRGFGAGALVERLTTGAETEVVTGLHSPRRGGGARIAAGVRRPAGGAILLSVDAPEVAALERQASLEHLFADMTRRANELAYVVLVHNGSQTAAGDAPEDRLAEPGSAPASEARAGGERIIDVKGRPVIEFADPVSLSDGDRATLYLGLRLDGLRRAEQRLLWRLGVSLGGALLLSALAFGMVWLRQEYGTLSRKHALAEAALRRRDRLSAMGELASTVAHEVRNPLNAIAMSAQRLRREFLATGPTASDADRAEIEQLLGVVEQESGRINRIVQQFLDFARPPRLAPRPTDLGTLVSQVVEASRAMAATRGVSVEADTAHAREARVDPDQLRQALHNLVTNAVDATPDAGTVRVASRSGSREHTIEVRDTGTGIDPQVLPRIFDLYFTTKPRGTGIGLAVTQQIVTAHGGTIEVDSQPGAGTLMRITVPARVEESVGG